MTKRCFWVNEKNINYVNYHDNEWGKPVYDDKTLFEFLILESFQAGLSWECILNKRANFQKAFFDFDIKKVSNMTETDVNELINNPGIIRNKLKIKAAINNAKIFLDIQKEWGSFSKYIWHFSDFKIINNQDGIIRSTSELSDTISKDLKKQGMKFVGSTIIYSYLQAIGIINDHDIDCDFK